MADKGNMKGVRGILVLVVLAPVFGHWVSAVPSQTPAPSEADWTWLNEHRESAFDRLMPVESRPRQVVAYRSYRDLYQDEYETYFQIGLADGPLDTVQKLRATLIVPVTRSLQQQLLELHKSDQQATLESFFATREPQATRRDRR